LCDRVQYLSRGQASAPTHTLERGVMSTRTNGGTVESVFSELQAAPLSEVALTAIRDAIMEGRLAPGEAINQVELARQLGISRSPLREALRQLEKEGLVSHVPYRGTIVAPLTARHVAELQSLRRLLEGFALEQLLQNGDDADLEALEQLIRQMERAAQEQNVAELTKADAAFHDSVFRMSRHDLLYSVWQIHLQQLRRVLALRNRLNPDPHSLVALHAELVQALRSRDRERVMRCYEAHGADLALVLEHFGSDAMVTDLSAG